MSDDDVIKEVEKLEQLPYEDLLQIYGFLNTMFIEKFGVEEDF